MSLETGVPASFLPFRALCTGEPTVHSFCKYLPASTKCQVLFKALGQNRYRCCPLGAFTAERGGPHTGSSVSELEDT